MEEAVWRTMLLSNCHPTKGVKRWTAHKENPFANHRQTFLHRVWGRSNLSNQCMVWRSLLLSSESVTSHFRYISCPPIATAKSPSNHHMNTDFCYNITSEKAYFTSGIQTLMTRWEEAQGKLVRRTFVLPKRKWSWTVNFYYVPTVVLNHCITHCVKEKDLS